MNADIAVGVEWVFRILFLAIAGLAVWDGTNWKDTAINLALAGFVFSAPQWPEFAEQIYHERKQQAAKALPAQRCSSATAQP
jgi:hypothetical protein